MNKDSLETVGIVVIGKNEGKRLIRCLESVIVANVPVIYVDSQSADNSIDEAEQRGVETISLDAATLLSAARARNEGFLKLIEEYPRIEYVHFIDGDCELAVEWLPKAVAVFAEQESVAVVCGRLREKFRNDSVYMRLCDMDWFHSPGMVLSCGGIATYRSSVFATKNGFDARLIAGEEPELCSRIRADTWDILCIEAEMGTHDSAMHYFSQWWTRCVKVGFGYMSGMDWGGWAKQYKSALFWGCLLPVLLLFSAFMIHSLSLLGFILYPVQIYRIFSKYRGDHLTVCDRFIYAFFCMLSKFPETQGLVTYFVGKLFGNKKTIQYK